jgi:hypothetical protein
MVTKFAAGKAIVLVVEDEPLVRMVAVGMMNENAGF